MWSSYLVVDMKSLSSPDRSSIWSNVLASPVDCNPNITHYNKKALGKFLQIHYFSFFYASNYQIYHTFHKLSKKVTEK